MFQSRNGIQARNRSVGGACIHNDHAGDAKRTYGGVRCEQCNHRSRCRRALVRTRVLRGSTSPLTLHIPAPRVLGTAPAHAYFCSALSPFSYMAPDSHLSSPTPEIQDLLVRIVVWVVVVEVTMSNWSGARGGWQRCVQRRIKKYLEPRST